MIELQVSDYFDLVKYLKGSESYVIEPFIAHAKMEEITIDSELFFDTKITCLKKDNIYYNLFCTIIKNKDLNGIEEGQLNILGTKIINTINNPIYKTIPRYSLNLDNYNKYKKELGTIIIKNSKQKYFENNLYWDWFKII